MKSIYAVPVVNQFLNTNNQQYFLNAVLYYITH